ncbi:MAG: alpha/beta fold hydrolase, partial [Candidatus Sumerlaeota bacterium]|nr:alpha/beta fold hydrolase [Candidatus Sumerlaeota bacterium]
FHGEDGMEIPAYIRKPAGDGPFPVIVLLHGGGASPDGQGAYKHGHLTYPTSQFLAEGWAVYAIEFRPDSNLLPVEWQDTIAAIEYAKELPYVDSSRVAVMGCSHGGHIMARVAARARVSCAVLAAPAVLNLLEIANDPVKLEEENAHVHKMLPGFVALLEKEFKAPIAEIVKNPKQFGYESPLAEMDKIETPVLLICGQNDDNYHVIQPYGEKLKELGKTVQTYYPENGPHGFQVEHPMIPETEEAAARAVAFIRKNFRKNPIGAGAESARPAAPVRTPQYNLKLEWLDLDTSEPSGTHYGKFRSELAKSEYSYLIYLPPTYESEPARRYPVIYWLHGGGGSQRTGSYFVDGMDQAIRAKKAPETIIVLVNGVDGSLYSDFIDGSKPVESVIIQELIPHIDQTYRTVGTRETRAIEGFSMGGFGALHLGFKYPRVFGSVTGISHAPIGPGIEFRSSKVWQYGPYQGNVEYFKDNDPFQLAEKNTDLFREGTRIRLIVGTGDKPPTVARTKELHDTLDALSIHHTLITVPKVGHDCPKLYEKMGESEFSYYSEVFPVDAE